MVWSAPMTAVAGSVFTAAQFNTFVRDNLNETAPALASQAGSMFIGTGVNSIAERIPEEDTINTQETTTSTSPTDLATVGPFVTVSTGTRAIVAIRSALENSSAGPTTHISYDVSGATSISADITRAATIAGLGAGSRIRIGFTGMIVALNPGFNTFTMKYWVTAGTGTFVHRQITVIPL